jgi:hypothetical protein
MGAFNPRKFVNPDTLTSVSLDNLRALLRQTASAYLAAPWTDGLPRFDVDAADAAFDFDRLTRVLLRPDDGYPDDLADALHAVAELSDAESLDLLLEAMDDVLDPFALGDEPTPADIALQAWLADRHRVEIVLGRQFLDKAKTFSSYRGPDLEGPTLPRLTEAALAPLLGALKAWYLKNKGSDFVRVIPYEREDGVWFLVRHATPPQRKSVVRNGQPVTTVERPEKHDLVVYLAEHDELAIHATTKGEEQLYLQAFGAHLFPGGRTFTDTGKYSLTPLERFRADSLSTAGVDGIERVVVRRVSEVVSMGVVRTLSAADVVAWYDEDPDTRWPRRISMVTFDVKFTGVRRPRKLTIRTPNIAKYHREGDKDLVDTWMAARGFVVERA